MFISVVNCSSRTFGIDSRCNISLCYETTPRITLLSSHRDNLSLNVGANGGKLNQPLREAGSCCV